MKKLTLGLFIGRDIVSQLIATDLLPFFSGAGHRVEIFSSIDHETFIPENREFKNYLFFTNDLLQKKIIPFSDEIPEQFHFWAPTPKQVNDKFGFKTHAVDNINGQNFLKKLSDLGVDCALNIGFEQKFKKPLLTYFEVKKSAQAGFCLNLHNGLLPHYRGVMPLFRSMMNGEKYGGFTLHHLEDNTHTGAIVQSDKYEIDYAEPMFANLINNYGLAVAMVLNNIMAVGEGKTLKAAPQSVSEGNYFSYPTSTEINAFMQKGLNLYEEDSLLSLISHIYVPTLKHGDFLMTVSHEIKKAKIVEEKKSAPVAKVIPLFAYRQKKKAAQGGEH